jgi:hypothetical protein
MQEQAGGERSWPAPPSIGTGYLRRVPVKLKQRPRLVSVAAVIAFIVNATHLVTGGSGSRRLEGWVGKEDGGGQRSGGLEAKAYAVSQWMEWSRRFPVVAISIWMWARTLPVVIVFSLRRQA